MVKGTNRRVIVVRSPDQLFEEAIFVLKEGEKTPQDAAFIIEQARQAAGDYLKKCGAASDKRKPMKGLAIIFLCLFLAAAAMAVVWLFLI